MAKMMDGSQKFPEGEPATACCQEGGRLQGLHFLLLQYSQVLQQSRRKNTSIYNKRIKHLRLN